MVCFEGMVAGVGEEQYLEVVPVGKSLVTLRSICAYTEDLRTHLCEILKCSIEGESFKRAPGGVVTGVKVEDYPFPAELREAHLVALRIREAEWWRRDVKEGVIVLIRHMYLERETPGQR